MSVRELIEPAATPASSMPAKKTPLLLALLAALVCCAIVVLPVATSEAPAQISARPSPAFFGIAPQTELTSRDVQYMRAGGIGSVRLPFLWHLIQPTPKREYDWSGVDSAMETISRNGLRVLPFLFGTPGWLAGKEQRLPIDSGRARSAWVAFVKAAVERYGPGGDFWTERAVGGVGPNYLPVISRPLPIQAWQVWNEANFFYFAFPVSPSRYARLLKLTQPAIRSVDRRAEVILSGLFGNPDEGGRRGMDASDFLDRLYAVPGIKARFDAIALHPYAFHVDDFEELTEQIREVALDNRDPRARLYITEMGWGSQNDPHIVAFEQGVQGQVRELRGTYRYLLANRGRLNLKGTYWFSWKDLPDSCNFCDSVGLFRAGPAFRPKPSWRAFVAISGGRMRP